MSSKKLRNRIYKAMFAYIALAGMLVFGVYFAPYKIESKGAGIAETYRDVNTRGKIYDRNMVAIVWNDPDTKARRYSDAELYQPFVGYYSKRTGRISGLEKLYDDTLLYSSPRYQEGCSLVLTIDSGIQGALAEAMNRDIQGAAVVMDASTGAILGMLSNPSYNPQTIDEDYNKLQETNYFVNKAATPLIPGSVMKIVSSAAIVKAGLEREVYNDTGTYVLDSFPIVNNAQGKYGNVALKEGIGYSVNTYFAYLSQKVGKEAYDKNLKDFYFGKTLKLDFATISSSYNIDTPLNLAVTSYGQGETTVSPIQITMATAAVANGGTLYKPFMIEKTVDPSNKEQDKTKPEVLGKPITKQEAESIASGMKLSAERLGFKQSLDVYSKTGTAETGQKGKDNLWLTAYFKHNGNQYAITMVLLNRAGTGSNLSNAVESVIKYIVSTF